MRMEGGAGINVKYQYVCAGCGLLMEGKEEILMYKSDQHFVKGALVGKLWTEDIRFFSRRKWLLVIREKEANLTKKIRKQILGE